MTELPDHPVRKQPRFIMLHQVVQQPDRFGVKLKNQNSSGGTFWLKPVWIYGATPLEALDSALAYLVAETLQE